MAELRVGGGVGLDWERELVPKIEVGEYGVRGGGVIRVVTCVGSKTCVRGMGT